MSLKTICTSLDGDTIAGHVNGHLLCLYGHAVKMSDNSVLYHLQRQLWAAADLTCERPPDQWCTDWLEQHMFETVFPIVTNAVEG